MTRTALTEARRELVAQNLGLVGTHLRRYVSAGDQPRRDREWDDLFQEGCVGLASAAATYNPASGIAFAAYALKRIHSAISRAFPRAFETVRVPDAERTCSAEVRHVVSLEIDPPTRETAPRHDLFDRAAAETVGERIRGKVEDAVRSAVRSIEGDRSRRSPVARRLAEERMLVPSESHRRGLRQIVRDTNATYSRVNHTEKRLAGLARKTLDADAEFCALRAAARRGRWGMDTAFDTEVRADVSKAVEARLASLIATAPEPQRTEILLRLIRLRGATVGMLIGRWVARLTMEEKRSLLVVCGGG